MSNHGFLASLVNAVAGAYKSQVAGWLDILALVRTARRIAPHALSTEVMGWGQNRAGTPLRIDKCPTTPVSIELNSLNAKSIGWLEFWLGMGNSIPNQWGAVSCP